MQDLTIFKNENLGEIRVIIIDNEPLFCLADICKALNLTNTTMVANTIKLEFGDDSSLTYPIIDNLGRKQNATFVTEAQLYFVLMRSNTTEAKEFRKLIYGKTLSSIKSKEQETFLYLIKNLLTNETKIGYAKNYKSRIRSIISQGGIQKYKYMVFKGNKPQKIEKKLHAIFRHKRMVGEWFILNDKDIFKIKNLMLNEYGFTIENGSIYQKINK
jgi:prophage antirepressor-like protein